MNRNKKTKPIQSARKKLFDSDAYIDVLDAALTSAEEELELIIVSIRENTSFTVFR